MLKSASALHVSGWRAGGGKACSFCLFHAVCPTASAASTQCRAGEGEGGSKPLAAGEAISTCLCSMGNTIATQLWQASFHTFCTRPLHPDTPLCPCALRPPMCGTPGSGGGHTGTPPPALLRPCSCTATWTAMTTSSSCHGESWRARGPPGSYKCLGGLASLIAFQRSPPRGSPEGRNASRQG